MANAPNISDGETIHQWESANGNSLNIRYYGKNLSYDDRDRRWVNGIRNQTWRFDLLILIGRWEDVPIDVLEPTLDKGFGRYRRIELSL